MARGHQRCNLRRVVIGFDPDTFAELNARAKRAHTSFAEEVRTLITWGLESANAS